MPLSEKDIRSLLDDLVAGKETAQRVLFKRFWDRPYREANAILRQQSDAYDVTAGLLLDFMTTGVHGFRGTSEGALRRYLQVSARRRAVVARTRSQRAQELVDELPAEAQTTEPWLLAKLEACLSALPARTRSVLRLKYTGDRSNAEVAQILGQTRANISKFLTHPQKGALARLRRCLGSVK